MRKLYTSICCLTLFLVTEAATPAVFDEISKYVEPSASPRVPSAMTFVDNDEAYLQLSVDGKCIVKYETRTGKVVDTIFRVDYTRETTLPSIEGFELSPDGSKILVWTDSREQYRHSFSAKYYFYEIRSRLLRPLSTERERQQAPVFSPDGRMVAYVHDNNIYIKKLDYLSDIAVTTDGKTGEVINGIPDWTYQEEFATTGSMTWTSDNLILCFLKYNETDVPMFSFPLYRGSCPEMPEYSNYPGRFSYKYPVAGQPNSKVTLHAYNVETRKTTGITLPGKQIEYIPRIISIPSSPTLLCLTLNRDQNHFEIYSVNPRTCISKSIYLEKSNAWIEPEAYEDITTTGDGFIIASSRTGFRHFYKYDYSGNSHGAITSGDYDVTKYYGYNAKTACHYVQTTAEGAINRTLHKIDAKGRSTLVGAAEGTTNATFSPEMKYCIVNYSNVTTPPRYSIAFVGKFEEVRCLEDNSELKSRFASAPKAEFFRFSNNGVELNGYIVRTANVFGRKFPVILNQYSGPGSQEVLNKWKIGWENYYAQQGFVIICVDGRGTGGRGRAFSDVVYKNLGYYETLDQIAAAKYAASLPYCDGSKIGIYGWSYGGYEALMAATAPDSPFAAAVAVAPVTDWRFYDTIYAERYMLTPQQNESGYDASSPCSRAANLNCPLLIIHGTADDNVHFYNSLHFMNALEGDGRWADLMPVVNANHSIRGCNRRALVYVRMLDFFNRNLKANH